MDRYRPTKEQDAIIQCDDPALVIAGPGRGKTVTAIAAAKAWLVRNPEPAKVLFTSFSNAAVKRLGAAAGIDLARFTKRVQYRTFHSLAMEILRDFGRFTGLRHPARALDKTEETLIAGERGWKRSDEQTYQAAIHSLACDEGLIAFELMVPLATGLLQASPTIRRAVGSRYPFIIIDEFQDTRAEQWELLKLLGEWSRVVALGDPNQMIYERQYQAARSRMREFCHWKAIQPTTFDGPNFRCKDNEIIQFAEALLHGHAFQPTEEQGLSLWQAYPNQRRATLAIIWSEIRRQAGTDFSIAFIAPSVKTAGQLAAELRSPDSTKKAAIPVYARVETDVGALDAFRFLVCAAVDWTREKDDVSLNRIAIALNAFESKWGRRKVSRKRIELISRRLGGKSRAASPLRDYLTSTQPEEMVRFAEGLLKALIRDKEFYSSGGALSRHGIPSLRGISLDEGSLFDRFRLSRAAAGLQGNPQPFAHTTALSMYRCKGREFDFVVLIVEPRDHSNQVTIEELRRLYYVSATRAREWLCVLYVPNRKGPVLGPVLKS